MSYAIVYSSCTGNTKLLADTVREALPQDACLYFGAPSADALRADRIYVGFWTDKGTCDEDTAKFLKTVTDQEIYLFGTAGFGVDQSYFDKVLRRTEQHLSTAATILGRFMCQGKMPMTVRQRYEKMMNSPIKPPNLKGMIENFDRALSHPDQNDLDALCAALRQN